MCTRVVYHGKNQQIFTARSMDWKVDVNTNIWQLPRGVKRVGSIGPNPLTWTSTYGSVVSTGYDMATTDGVNEKGLSVNLLWLVESQYPTVSADKPTLSIAIWGQYILDQFASVADAVATLKDEPYTLVTAQVPGEDRLATLHMSISDSSGDSAIIEYIDGKQVIHHDRSYQVMTNSPTYDEQLALNKYWQEISGTVMLPGTNRAADRFARASFYVNAVAHDDDPDISLASVLSVIRNASVPYGLNTAEEPNISSTRWRTVVDHQRLLYFFESTLTPNVFWVDLKSIDFNDSQWTARKLDLGANERNIFSGKTNAEFQPHPDFHFLGTPAA